MVLLFASTLPVLLLAANGEAGAGFRFFELDEPIDRDLTHKAIHDSQVHLVLAGATSAPKMVRNILPPSPTHLARPFPMIMLKQCWLYSEACRQIAKNKALARQARELMDWDGPLYLRTVQVISKPRGSVHRLHTDLDMWAPECAGKQSATVWTLVQSDADDARGTSVPKTPLRLVTGSEKIGNVTADHFLANTGCWNNMLVRPEARCSTEKVVAHAKRVWPEAGLELMRKGPVRTGEGVAWLGHVWHATDDTFNRKTLLLQYGTEACMRAVRAPYLDFDVRKHWSGPDWYPFFPVEDLAPPQPLAHASALDPYYLNLNLPGAAGACSLDFDETSGLDAAHGGAVAKLDQLLVVPRAAIDLQKPSWEASDGESHVRDWPRYAHTASLDYFSAHLRQWSAKSTVARRPRAARVDEICVVLAGSVQYAVSLEGMCGPGNVSAFTVKTGHVNLLPAGAYHTAAGNAVGAQELCFKLTPRGRKQARGLPKLNFVQIHVLQKVMLASEAVPQSLRVPASGGPQLALGQSFETPIWSVRNMLGYRHLSSKVQSMGPGGSYRDAGRHDLIVVPLGSGVLTVLESAHPQRSLFLGDFAVIPEGAQRSFQTETGVDALFIELKV